MSSPTPLRVAVLSGGTSTEREISLDSGRAARAALAEAGPRAVETWDVQIAADGRWSVEGSAPESAAQALARLADCHLVFLGLHGGEGEDGTLQALLEGHGLAYTGSGVRASSLCMDKHALRLVAADGGLDVAPGFATTRGFWKPEAEAVLDRAHSLGETGWFVKPRFGGSSVSTFAVEPDGDLRAAIQAALDDEEHVLVEAWVRGVEVSCGVLGDHDGPLQSLTPIEIQPADGAFFDYQQKYDAADGAREVCPPERLDDDACRRIRLQAERAHRLAGCRGHSRVDFICPPDSAPVLLELNTLPGLTPRSLLPQEAAHDGIRYRDLLLGMIDRALARGVNR